MISESQKESIKREAQEILKKFAKSLESVPNAKPGKSQAASVRKEGPGKTASPEFRKRMFANAPRKDENHLIAEKASWGKF